MLIHAKFKNLLSFDEDGVEFSMVAGEKTHRHPVHIMKVTCLSVLKGSVMFGANASGKSNFIKAFQMLRQMIEEGNCTCAKGKHFALGPNAKVNAKRPSIWEVAYSWGENIFRYVLTTDGKTVQEENLSLVISNTEMDMIFHRRGGKVWFGKHFKEFGFWYKGIKCLPCDLMLGRMLTSGVLDGNLSVQNAHVVRDAISGLTSIHVVPKDLSRQEFMFQSEVTVGEFAAFLSDFLGSATGEIDKVVVPKGKVSKEVVNSLVATGEYLFGTRMVASGKEAVMEPFKLMRHGREITLSQMGNYVRRLLTLAAVLFLMKKGGEESTWLIDDFGEGLHPLLNRHLVKMMQEASKCNRQQFLLTTHDVTLLDEDLWRHDEIWFSEKFVRGSTNLFSLYSFGLKGGRDLQKDYLLGRFGGRPLLGDIWPGEEG